MDKTNNKFKSICFDKYIFSVSEKVSIDDLTRENKLEMGFEGLDFIKNKLTVRLSTYVLAHKTERLMFSKTFKAPSFWDWLFRRKRTMIHFVDVMDCLINAPILKEGTTRIYKVIEFIENE